MNTIKTIILTFIMALATLPMNGQEQPVIRKNLLTFTVGGYGMFYSVAYEHNFAGNFWVSAGTSFLRINENQTNKYLNTISLPVSVKYLQNLGRNKHFIEAGIGTMNLITSGNLTEYNKKTDWFVNPVVSLGYRYFPAKSRWSVGVAITPVFGSRSLTDSQKYPFAPLGMQIQPWGGISVSYNLSKGGQQ